MMKKPILLTLACGLLFSTGCAAKNRWFSRKDYSEIQDPFMETEAVASKDESPASEGSRDSAGRAKMGGTASSTGSVAKSELSPGSPPKSVLQTGASEDGVARVGRIANASYPEKTAVAGSPTQPGGTTTNPAVRSYQGPALSDFLSRKQTESVTAAADKANAVTRTASEVAKNPASAISPAARAAAIPDLSEEAAGFDNFLQKGTDTVTSRARQAASKVQETEQSAEDFNSWASQEKQKWTQEGSNAAAAVSTAPAAAKKRVESTSGQIRKAADDVVTEFETPEFDEAATARPLLKRYSPAPATSEEEAEFEFEQAPSKRSSGASNPFANPFDDEEVKATPPKKRTTTQSSTSGKESSKSLDSSFQMDSGWKPSHLTNE
ncbi:MAG: hypothetical protein DWI00_10565 [Planctomycetota bacterium]|nr:MAG: hypothetical protein DWI00_10565 [Planctomycetota bacterium]